MFVEGTPPDVVWHGRRYRLPVPVTARAVRFLVLDGLDEPPRGDAVVVVRPRGGWLDALRRREVVSEVVRVEPVGG